MWGGGGGGGGERLLGVWSNQFMSRLLDSRVSILMSLAEPEQLISFVEATTSHKTGRRFALQEIRNTLVRHSTASSHDTAACASCSGPYVVCVCMAGATVVEKKTSRRMRVPIAFTTPPYRSRHCNSGLCHS